MSTEMAANTLPNVPLTDATVTSSPAYTVPSPVPTPAPTVAQAAVMNDDVPMAPVEETFIPRFVRQLTAVASSFDIAYPAILPADTNAMSIDRIHHNANRRAGVRDELDMMNDVDAYNDVKRPTTTAADLIAAGDEFAPPSETSPLKSTVEVRVHSLAETKAAGAAISKYLSYRNPQLRLEDIDDEDIRKLLDPNDRSVRLSDVENWPEEKIAALLAVVKPMHSTILIRKSVAEQAAESASTLSFRNLSYASDGIDRLSNVTGYILPGMLIGVLGAPDAGVTTLFNVLTGRHKGGELSGELLVNGSPPKEDFNKQIGYVVKNDLNYAELTVAETLYFSARLRASRILSSKILRIRIAIIMKALGLSHTANTVVGDANVRGISGGEKRRVSYACEVVCGHSVIIADLPTNGLDSASAFSLISNFKYANASGRSLMCSIVQPAPELFNLFTHILLLSKGAQLYFGPATHIEGYLNSQGFYRDEVTTLPDFVEELSAHPEKFWKVRDIPISITARQPKFAPDPLLQSNTIVEDSKVKAVTTELLASDRYLAWKRLSDAYKVSEFNDDVAAVFNTRLQKIPRLGKPRPMWRRYFDRFNSPFILQAYQVILRQAVLTYRKKGLWAGNFIKSIIVGLIVGSLFVNIGTSQSDVRTRFGLFFFMLSFNANSSVQMISVLLAQRQIFYTQVASGYFAPIFYYFSILVTRIPISLIESFLFIMIVYPISGLYEGIGSTAFLFTFCELFLINIIALSFVLFISAISPNQAIANVVAPIMNVLFSVFSGYLAPKSSIPNPWIWMYYISYFTYSIRALSISNIYYLNFPCGNSPTCQVQDDTTTGYNGPEVLDLYSMNPSSGYGERFDDMEKMVWFFIAFNVAGMFAMSFMDFAAVDTDEAPLFIDESDMTKKQSILPSAEQSKALITQPKACIEWKNLCYEVDIPNKTGRGTTPRVLLNKCFGYAKPGMMVALLGASGAGKSTLLDVLAGKKTAGRVTGDILINGKPKDETFSRVAGYVEQFDSHNGTSTIREAIFFSGRLRLPATVTDQELNRRVDNALIVLGLLHLQNELIGDPERGGVTPEARKKTTIAVELIMDPSLLFLDEPSTGLDSSAAFAVMSSVKQLAQAISVICTIHQPSARIMNMFDYVILLKAGGEIAYFGPTNEVSQYFAEHNLGVMKAGENVANFALEALRSATASSTGADGRPINLAEMYKTSSLAAPILKALEVGIVSPNDTTYQTVANTPFVRSSIFTQLHYLTQRFFLSTRRKIPELIARFSTPIIMGFIIGTLFYQMGTSQVDGSNRVSIIYLSLLFMIFSAGARLPEVFFNRPIYFRESQANMYEPEIYWLARSIADIPFVITEILLFSIMTYFLSGLTLQSNGTHFALFLLCMIGIRMMGIAWTHLMGTLLPSIELASGLSAGLLTIFMLFCGFLISKGNIPSGWIWMYYLSFIRYPLDFLVANELVNIQLTCDPSQRIYLPTNTYSTPCGSGAITASPTGSPYPYWKCQLSCGDEVLQSFQIDYSVGDRALNLGIVFIWLIGFHIFGMLATRYINHVKR